MLLPLRVTDEEEEAVPWRPSAAAPPVALVLPVLHPLKDDEVVGDVESDPEEEELALADAMMLAVEHCEIVRMSVNVREMLEMPLAE